MGSDRYFESGGARLRYRDEGTGAVVVLLHGWTVDLNMWDLQVEGLRPHLRLIRYDRRGFGLSGGVPSAVQDPEDLLALCRHLQAQPAGLVGMSQGARVVLSVLNLMPRWAGRVVFDGPPDLLYRSAGDADELDLGELATLRTAGGLEAFRKFWRAHPLTELATHEDTTRRLLATMINRYPGLDLQADAPSASPVPFVPISQSTLVLNGDGDTPSRLSAGAALAGALPDCERVVIPGARHFPNLDNPVIYNSQLLRFFLQPPVALEPNRV